MARILKDRVAETTTTTGTGALTLAGAIVGFRAFSSVCATSDTFYYMIEAIDSSGVPTGEWETGYGTYSGSNTLTRTAVFESSNSNAAVSFSVGTKRVTITGTATLLSKAGATVDTSQNTSSTSYTDLATAGPSVTLNTGAEVIVSWSCRTGKTSSGVGNTGFMAIDISGATTTAGSDTDSAAIPYPMPSNANFTFQIARRKKFTVTPGQNTFKAVYRVDGATWSFEKRDIVVELI